ncbi:putative periplasmic serine endoprotease DegP-like precursor [Rosistilla carotiformis]|uniref:Putative periplasmic serine endoprotease DegP-like n=1 Tax=Rosistilla carotiformis TaxID=2528017 RepID=A0A518JRU5_9BACT|nr:trypsin-like peptidase domain-containing protein [Rosistilla carotiformis]QDV68264.1 putative periplasmic serine endoprotease DegP-like precursor [Rosistilla carotiformis]
MMLTPKISEPIGILNWLRPSLAAAIICFPFASTHAQVDTGPRALSRAFQSAAKLATASVVTVISYGQNVDEQGLPIESSEEDEFNIESPEEDEGFSELDEIPHTKEMLPATGLGSGVILTAEGLIISNNHVIRDARRVIVRLHDGLEVTATKVLGDPASDIAIIQIETDETLVPAQLGNSKDLQIGEWVLAIGSPFRLDATVSAGIISAIGRRLDAIRRGRLLQTDAAINPGNSGGPLINLDGQVVGISTAIATRSGGYQGIGFAVPINQANWIARELAEYGEVRRASIGLSLAMLNPRIARQLELPMKTGILVVAVTKNHAAAKAGVEPYDVILEFNGQAIVKPRDLQEAIEREPIGSTQKLTVFRKGERLELTVTLEAAL